MTNQEQLVALVDSLKERFDALMKDIQDATALHAFTAYAEVRKGWCYPSHFVAFDEFVRGLFDSVADVHKEGKQLLGRNDEPLEDEEDDDERNERVLDSIETRFDVAFDALRRAGKDVLTSREQLDSFLYGLRLKAERVLESYDSTDDEEEETNVPVVETDDDEEDDEDDYTVEYIPPVEAKELNATCDKLGEKEVESVKENLYYLFSTALATLRRAVYADVYLSRDDLRRLTDDVRKSIDDAWKERDKTDYRRGSTECEMNKRHAIERLRRDGLTR